METNELVIKAVKADSTITTIYEGDFSLKQVGAELLNPITLQDIQSACNNARLDYSYNGETTGNKIKELASFLESIKLLLGYISTNGIVDNSLNKAGITRISDTRAKIKECIPNAPETIIDTVFSKYEQVQKIMAEVNEIFNNHRPEGLPKGEQYYFRHHFASPKSIAKPKSNN